MLARRLPRRGHTACRSEHQRRRVSISVAREAFRALGVLGPDRRIGGFITTGLTDAERKQLGREPTGRGVLSLLIDEARPLRLRHPPMRPFVDTPVEGRDALYGILHLTEAPDGVPPTRTSASCCLLAGMAAVAIENARLYQDSTEHAKQAATLLGERVVHEAREVAWCTMVTGAGERLIRAWETLPSRAPEMAPWPRDPTTRSSASSVAASWIVSVTPVRRAVRIPNRLIKISARMLRNSRRERVAADVRAPRDDPAAPAVAGLRRRAL